MSLRQIYNAALVLTLSLSLSTPGFANNNLAYQGNPDGQLDQPRAATAESKLSPMAYTTNYETEFSRYASFMESPYNPLNPNAGQVLGQQQGPPAAGYYPQGAGQGDNKDPYAASEVSPYAHYSPYLEVIGEGSDYTLGIDDVVTVIVRNQPDFSGRFVIDPEGKIQYGFAGDILAEGKTKGELKTAIVERLRKFVRHPEVAVMISQYRSKAVYVFGFVNRPGKYAMKGDKITIKEAVVAAGLPRGDGALKRVYVVRPSQFTETGEPQQKKINLKKLLYKGQSAENFLLKPGDTIVVNQKYFDKFVNAFSRLVGPLFQAAAVYELAYGSQDGFLN